MITPHRAAIATVILFAAVCPCAVRGEDEVHMEPDAIEWKRSELKGDPMCVTSPLAQLHD